MRRGPDRAGEPSIQPGPPEVACWQPTPRQIDWLFFKMGPVTQISAIHRYWVAKMPMSRHAGTAEEPWTPSHRGCRQGWACPIRLLMVVRQGALEFGGCGQFLAEVPNAPFVLRAAKASRLGGHSPARSCAMGDPNRGKSFGGASGWAPGP